MGLVFVFFLGIGNFAVHQAVLASDHPLLGRVSLFFQLLGGRFSLFVEFIVLVGAMLLAAQGSYGWALFYACYTAVNALAAWLILSRRI